MKGMIIGLLAETFLHPGGGDDTGVVDLPVAREVHTGYPVIFGSALKGALRSKAEESSDEVMEVVFGHPKYAGELSVTDARLILLPARSLNGHFRWLTCPYVLERYKRDRQLAGLDASFEIPPVSTGEALVASSGDYGTNIFLEELSFVTKENESIEAITGALAMLVPHDSVRARLKGGIVLLSDADFVHFANSASAVNARNVLDDDTKISTNLWYEETIPPDTLFYALLFARNDRVDVGQYLVKLFRERPYLQVGGNETIGQGWCAVSLVDEEGNVFGR